jgi:hypothetical protein
VTCAQQVATIVAAGYTAEQIAQANEAIRQEQGGASIAPEGFFDPTCASGGTNQYSLVFDGLPVAAMILSARAYDYGVQASPHHYRVVDDSTVEFGSHTGAVWGWCLTLGYAIDGDQLTIQRIAQSCTGTADAPLLDQIALTAILETSSFTRQP